MQLRENSQRAGGLTGERVSPASNHSTATSHHPRENPSINLYNSRAEIVAATANENSSARDRASEVASSTQSLKLLYTAEQRQRRDATKWTLVQGILAPIQFAVFLISVFFVVRYLVSGNGLSIATTSIVAKTMLLYAIMITGSIWEREVFGVYLFAPAFFWEDVFSFLVLGLHTTYLVMLLADLGDPRQQMFVALAGYAAYVINAVQFILKLRAARRDERLALSAATSLSGGAA